MLYEILVVNLIKINCNKSVIAVCKKLVKTQINTILAHEIVKAISQESLVQLTWSLLQPFFKNTLQGLRPLIFYFNSYITFLQIRPQNHFSFIVQLLLEN